MRGYEYDDATPVRAADLTRYSCRKSGVNSIPRDNVIYASLRESLFSDALLFQGPNDAVWDTLEDFR